MNKIVKRLYKYLLTEFFCVWILAIGTYVLGELGVIPNGLYAGDGSTPVEFYLNTACIVLMLVCVPLSLQLFKLNTRNGLRRMNKDESLLSYHLWSIVRLGLLFLCAEFGLVCYFLLMDTTGLLCAAMSMVMTLLCFPSEEKLHEYLSANEEERAESVN